MSENEDEIPEIGEPSDYLISPDEYAHLAQDELLKALFDQLFGGEAGENLIPPSPG